MDKSPEAFRTISEVAESLETPAHVLRFWESRFPQIKPVKRAGGRRYYRPADVALLGGIRHLLHDEGMTIRGVQKILREQGVRHVAALSAAGDGVDFEGDELIDDPVTGIDDAGIDDAEIVAPEPETAQVFALETVMRAPATPPTNVRAEVVQLHALPEPQGIPMAAPTAPPEEVPEAGHIWVDDEPELELAAPAPLFPGPAPAAESSPAPDAAPADQTTDGPLAGADPKMSGIAARLRALPHPIAPETLAELADLHSRLGLLHAQIAEVLRARR